MTSLPWQLGLALAVSGVPLVVSLIVWLYWRSLPAAERDHLRTEVPAVGGTLALIAALALIPLLVIAIRLPLPYALLWQSVGAALWAAVAVAFWESRAALLSPALWEQARIDPPVPGPQPMPAPVPVPTIPPAPTPVVPGNDHVHKVFRWTFEPLPFLSSGQTQTIEIDLSRARYEARKAENRLPMDDWSHYVTADMPEIRALAAHFWNLHVGQNWSTFEQASNVLRFTQECITYSKDKDTTPKSDWPRYPIETLMDETGDCEDDVILTAAVLVRLGFTVALLYYPRVPGTEAAHLALGVAGAEGLPGKFVTDPKAPINGSRYFYGETTATGWHLGVVPSHYEHIEPTVYPISIPLTTTVTA